MTHAPVSTMNGIGSPPSTRTGASTWPPSISKRTRAAPDDSVLAEAFSASSNASCSKSNVTA